MSHPEKRCCVPYHKRGDRFWQGTVLTITDDLIPLDTLVDNLWMSLASSVSYSGKTSLSDFIGDGVFEIKFIR